MINRFLNEQIQLLLQLKELLIAESAILKKGTAANLLELVNQKEMLVQQFVQLEAKRVSYSDESREASFLNGETLKLKENLKQIYEEVQVLVAQNEDLTQMAQQVAVERMAFYTSLTRENVNGYGRNGGYAKHQFVGSTLLDKRV